MDYNTTHIDTINVLVVEADKHPYAVTIPDTLEAKQEMVGGYIEAVYPFDDNICCICNEEGKLWGLPPNRMLWDEQGEPYDVLNGTFLVAGLGDEDFASLTPEEMDKYTERFWNPEFFALDEDREVVNYDDQRTTRQIDRETGNGAVITQAEPSKRTTEELDICD